ncbi:MAG: HDOD domain-containing protein [Opitutaceae bacterium]|nr:HDOD domain-containing protein [Opitutaceae bacterium]
MLPRLLTLLSDMDSHPDDVVDLINLDPALTATILRASRSAFYGGRAQSVENLEDALAAIGFKEVYRLVSLFVLSESAREPLVLYGLTPEAFWRKSVACALAMETLCGEMGAPGATGYTIGLLHAVGEIFVNRVARAQAPHGLPLVAFAQPLATPQQELEASGLTQSQAAAYAMRHWRFPETVIEPIEFQFQPHEAPTYTQMALRLRLGKWLTHLVLGDEATARAVNPEFHFAITVPGNSFARMVDDLRRRLDEAAGSLHGTGCAVA